MKDVLMDPLYQDVTGLRKAGNKDLLALLSVTKTLFQVRFSLCPNTFDLNHFTAKCK